jgi:holo-[acyl-carrier protein] synthase
MDLQGIGTDIIEIEKIKKHARKKDFLNKVFTEKEIEYAKKEKYFEHLATMFAIKEAVFKAMGTGWKDGKKIEIIHNKKGKPEIKIKGKKTNIMCSVSFCDKYAVAFVLIKK